MKTIVIFVILLLIPLACPAASTTDPLATLIAKTMDDGQVLIENAAMARKLGLAGENLVVKTVEIGEKNSGDGRNHYVSVFVHSEKDGRPVAYALKLGSGTIEKTNGQISIDGYVFLADLRGNLQKAFHNSGIAHHVQSEELPVDKRKTKKLFQKELEFFLAREK